LWKALELKITIFYRRREAMSLRKVCLFALAATLAGFAAVETLNVDIKEYTVPTPKSRPHDPALAPDGSLWYTGQAANKLGLARSEDRRI